MIVLSVTESNSSLWYWPLGALAGSAGALTERLGSGSQYAEILPGLRGYATSRSALRSYRRNNPIKLQANTLPCKSQVVMLELNFMPLRAALATESCDTYTRLLLEQHDLL